MSEVLVVVEATREFGVKKVTLEMLTLARELGTPSAVVLGGAGAAEALSAKLGEYGELTSAFRFLQARPSEASLIVVSYPLKLLGSGWTEAVETASKTHGVAVVDQVEFQLPGPDRVVVSLWRHRSAIVEPRGD